MRWQLELPPSQSVAHHSRPPSQSWSDNATNAACGVTEVADVEPPFAGLDGPEAFGSTAGPNPNTGFGVLFNAMIYPFSLGPLGIRTIIWFQGALLARRSIKCARLALIQFTTPPTPPFPPQARAMPVRTPTINARSPR